MKTKTFLKKKNIPVLYKPGDYVCNFVLFLNAIGMQNF